MLRILVGIYAMAWAGVRFPAHAVRRPSGRPVAAGRGVDPAGFAAGRRSDRAARRGCTVARPAVRRRLAVPGDRTLFAVAMLLLATLDSAWGQVFHTEHLVVLHLLVLAVAPAADVLATGRRRPTPGPAVDGRYGWPVRLAAVVVVLAYVIAGFAKLRIGGLDWLDGDTLRHWVAHDNLRKAVLGDSYSPIGVHLVRHAWLFPPLATLTVIVKLGAGVALFGGRWRTAWVVAAWLFHVGVLALMAIVFPYQLTGVAFAAFFRLERLADRVGHRATATSCSRRPRPTPGAGVRDGRPCVPRVLRGR